MCDALEERPLTISKAAGLIGLGIKAGELHRGFEQVRRLIGSGNAAYVLADAALGQNSLEKVRRLCAQQSVSLYRVAGASETSDMTLGRVTGYKIVGFLKNPFARGVWQKLKQENPWL